MNAKLRGTTGAYFDVVEINALHVKDPLPFTRYYADEEGTIREDHTLEFLPEESKEVTIEGWVAVDEYGIGGRFLHTQKPHAESREFCDTGEYEIGWYSDGVKYELDSRLFPDLTPETEPKKYRITITPIEE
ncbi:MAG: hypothetical protein K2M41_02315 [Muribaculaceae bacterium]|nr:hypothetical protein [Muribaculaceae bacterium]